ncbi:MAG: hypothetical protein WBE71_12295, partial [Xanthobacteraceae bacterium]
MTKLHVRALATWRQRNDPIESQPFVNAGPSARSRCPLMMLWTAPPPGALGTEEAKRFDLLMF